MRFGKIDWNRVFFKTYFEKRSKSHLLVNFNRIWILHISVYYFFTAFNSPRAYAPHDQLNPSPEMTWSATALGGAVSTLIMILATIAEYSYIPTTWNNASHLTTRLVFLLVILALTAGPTFYIAMVDGRPNQTSQVPLIVGIVQFFISAVVTLAFGLIPSGRMFGDRVAGKSRKYMASQTFTASYPALSRGARSASIFIWILIFGCKFVESYFFLTSSFSSPIAVMVRTKVQGCNDKIFKDALCSNQVLFTLAIMYVMDLVLFFLDTYLWYIIWIVVFSIGRAFALGLSIWTPWTEIFTRMPKRIYAKLLATGEMEVKYKPKVYMFLLRQRNDIDKFNRSSCLKSGTLSLFLCTANICFPSTTYNGSYTTKWTARTAAAPYVPRHSSPTKPATKWHFSLRVERPSVASHSSHLP